MVYKYWNKIIDKERRQSGRSSVHKFRCVVGLWSQNGFRSLLLPRRSFQSAIENTLCGVTLAQFALVPISWKFQQVLDTKWGKLGLLAWSAVLWNVWMESGAPAPLMLSTWLHVAAVWCRSVQQSHFFHERDVCRTVKKKKTHTKKRWSWLTIVWIQWLIDRVVSSCVFSTRRCFFTMPILLYAKGDENAFKTIFLFC